MEGFGEEGKKMSIKLCPNISAGETLLKHKTDEVKLQNRKREM
jgi:hypothetical protein